MAEKTRAAQSNQPENHDDDQREAEAPQEGDDDFFDTIEAYKEEGRLLNAPPNFELFKYHALTGKGYSSAGYWTGDDIPNKDEIGRLFGGGRYWYILRHAKGKGEKKKATCKTFYLHERYDELKRQADEEKRQQEAQRRGSMAGTPAPAVTAQETFTIVKDILALIMPVMKEANRQPAQIAAQPAPDMLDTQRMIQQVLKKNLFETAETYSQLARKMAQIDNRPEPEDLNDEENDEPEQPKGTRIMEMIIKMIEPFFGLIAQNTIAGKTAAAALKAAPKFAEIIQDKRLCQLIVNYFDQTKGRAAADIALKNIGIKRDELFKQQQPTATAAPAAAAARKQNQPGIVQKPKQ